LGEDVYTKGGWRIKLGEFKGIEQSSSSKDVLGYREEAG